MNRGYSPLGDIFAPREQSSPLGANVTPGGQSPPYIESRLKTGRRLLCTRGLQRSIAASISDTTKLP
jgi:hypothetical protein